MYNRDCQTDVNVYFLNNKNCELENDIFYLSLQVFILLLVYNDGYLLFVETTLVCSISQNTISESPKRFINSGE